MSDDENLLSSILRHDLFVGTDDSRLKLCDILGRIILVETTESLMIRWIEMMLSGDIFELFSCILSSILLSESIIDNDFP